MNQRRILVTGSSRGIGKAIAETLAQQGVTVICVSKSAESCGATAAAIIAAGGKAKALAVDVADGAAIAKASEELLKEFPAIDILVNNAGTAESAPLHRSDTALFERMIAMHLMAPVHASKAVLPSMLERGAGHIVNVASVAGLMGAPYVTAYSSAKHAMIGLTRSLALELGPRGVAVNAVCPAYTDTDLVTGAVERIVQRTGRSASDALQSILSDAGQSRIVTSEEVADAVLALCNAPPGAAVGQTVVIDGRTAETGS